jgi:hypothetical protein
MSPRPDPPGRGVVLCPLPCPLPTSIVDEVLIDENVVSLRMLSEELSRYVLPMTQFDGLCLQARRAAEIAAFWRIALHGCLHDLGSDRFRIDPAPGRKRHEIVRVIQAAVPSPDRSRVHLDLRLRGLDPAPLLQAGARIIRRPGTEPWYVLADPEGNEFCAFPSVDDRPAGIFELVIKCRDAAPLARWWATVLGGDMFPEGEAAVVMGVPDFPWDYMVFDPVPEPKTTNNRMHWHVTLRDPDPAELTAIGAVVLSKPNGNRDWWVLADPEGNEFCASVPSE